uniref:Cyclin-K n=1 Tax=Anopheles minimus TaxID=112268 RepID=A0A182W7E0_9DIPT
MPNWYYDKKDLRNTPSARDGIDYETERRYRKEGARFIMEAGASMSLGHNTVATGVVYFHRFYMFHSFRTFPRYVTASCCLFLAGKVEETPKKCKDIIKTARGLLADEKFQSFGDDPKEEVMTLERILLQTIKFDLQVEHPYSFLVKYAKCLKGDSAKLQKMVQMAWNFVNDSLSTTVSIQWEPEIIAVALIYLASKLSKFTVVDWVGKKPEHLKWWDMFVQDVTMEILEEICHQVLDLYQPSQSESAPSKSPPQLPPSKASPPMKRANISPITSKNSPNIAVKCSEKQQQTKMLNTNLVVPVVLWGPNTPTHCVSSVFLSRDQKILATGCYDGQICLWQVDPDTLQMTPRCLLVGHTAPVLCLTRASIIQDNNFLVSSSENGEMCTWDLVDGKCTESIKMPQVHTNIQAYHMANCDDIRLFCNGYYAEIMVMDPFSLEVLFCLSSKVNPDWISALHVLRPSKRKDDVVLAITTTGTVKVWTLLGNENKYSEPIYENESKQIRCLNAITMNCCSQNQRTVLIVCAKYWQIYDAGDFTVLCSVISPAGERWMGGDFLSNDRVILWSDEGKGYLFRLPANSIPDNKDFHGPSVGKDSPFLYCILSQTGEKPLSCPPTMKLVTSNRSGKTQKYLLRGDSEGYVNIWAVPDISMEQIKHIQAQKQHPASLESTICTSLLEAWNKMNPLPVGILDQLYQNSEPLIKLTASIYLPQQSRLVVGREDGSIIIVPATQTVMLHLLHGNHQQFSDWPPHQILNGHSGRVNCLLCPSLAHSRYDKSHLVSGGVDFAVCLWDLYSGSLIHRFCVHAGEITQLLVPPPTCSPRILKCICSVASDHSVTLLSLQERKCVTLASRHLFPVISIKWRPLDDFLIVGCSDGTVYVWQMETGHLDRVLHGILAEEVLNACDENSGEVGSSTGSTSEMGLANPAVHFFRGLRHRNINAIRHATQRGIHQLQQLHAHNNQHGDFLMKNRSSPLIIQGLRTNPKGILAKMKEGAENVQTKVQAKLDSVVKNVGETGKDSSDITKKIAPRMEATHVMEVAQLLLSLIHSWGLDPHLDKVCETQLGLLRPMIPVSFGVLSKGGYMSLLLPTWQNNIVINSTPEELKTVAMTPEQFRREGLTKLFTARLHWELSTTLTSNHLLAMVAMSNTLMSMNMATFIPEQERARKLHRQSTRATWSNEEEQEEAFTQQQAQIKQGWSLLSTHHCFLLPEKIDALDANNFKRPQVEMMARRWQHHCLEIREAAQQLLLGELGRMGKKGRKQLVESWAQYLPMYTHTEPIAQQPPSTGQSNAGSPTSSPTGQPGLEHEEESEEEEEVVRKPSSLAELKRKQTTAVVLLGVIGAEFGQDISATDGKRNNENRRKSSVVEGFGIGNNNLARSTSMALTHLLLAPATQKLPAYTPLRRAAIDLIGRGFTVWEPYIDVSKVLLGLLEMCCDSTRLIPSLNYKLPLTPQADACRTARHALRLIATARPAAFITTMAREVARYNTMQQNAQAISVPITQSVLHRAKREILQCVEMLIDKMQTEIANLLVEVMDITLHCVDSGDLKNKGLAEVSPLMCKFNQVSHCSASRRIAVGASNGHLAIYELRQNKCQMIPAHTKPVTALAFSPDGKFLVSYSCTENRLSFWQTSAGMFGLGQSQTRCIKGYSTAPIPDIGRLNPMRLAKLIWINNRTVTLMLADGSETRFNV